MSPAQAKQQFEKFDKTNPHVYDALADVCRQVMKFGRKKYGMQAIFERLRWLSDFETTGDPYKLNHYYRAFYTRKLMQDPEFEGLITKRHSPLADV